MNGVKLAGLLGLMSLVLLVPRDGSAAVRLGAGANYWLEHGGLFNLDLQVNTPIAKRLFVGGRFGAFLTTGSERVGIPLDLALTVPIGGRVYIEGLAGPWLSFEGDFIRAHGAIGFGLRSGNLSFGLEAGWLSPSGIIGARLSWRI
ncbi:MAG: hypothetical protein ACOX6T_00860 [Myxococcales bacterium]|jgi:hypothetical protein